MSLDFPLSDTGLPFPGWGRLGVRAYDVDADSHPHREPMHIRCWKVFSQILNTDPGKNLISQLDRDPRVQRLSGQLISSGSGGSQFELQRLAMWYLWLLNRSDKEVADTAFERFLESPDLTVVPLIGLEGIEITKAISLTTEVNLLPASDLPECDLKDTLLRSRFSSSLLRMPPFVGGFISGVSSVPKIWNPDSAGLSRDLAKLDRWFQNSYDAALLLNCLPGIAAVPSFQTSVVQDETPFGPFNGSGGGTYIHGRSVTRSCSGDLADAAAFVEAWGAFQNQTETQKKPWRKALTRLGYAKTTRDASDELLELGIALEMLLQKDNSNREQLSLAFRLRGSWLVEPSDGKRRRAAYDSLKFVYDCRSDVAHLGNLPEMSRKRFEEERSNIFAMAERIARTLLVQPPNDWVAVVLGIQAE